MKNEMSSPMKYLPDVSELQDDVASLALSIATGNEYLNGQIITLDGGWI